MATHSSILAWRIPWKEEPGRVQYMGSQRGGHDWATNKKLLSWLLHKWPLVKGIRKKAGPFSLGFSPLLQRNSCPWITSEVIKSLVTLNYTQSFSSLAISKDFFFLNKQTGSWGDSIMFYTLLLLSHFSHVRLCDPVDGSPPGSPLPGILQARTLEWAAISFSNAWKWKVKVKSPSRVRLLATPWTAAYQAPLSMGFSSNGVGCHCLLQFYTLCLTKTRLYSEWALLEGRI